MYVLIVERGTRCIELRASCHHMLCVYVCISLLQSILRKRNGLERENNAVYLSQLPSHCFISLLHATAPFVAQRKHTTGKTVPHAIRPFLTLGVSEREKGRETISSLPDYQLQANKPVTTTQPAYFHSNCPRSSVQYLYTFQRGRV